MKRYVFLFYLFLPILFYGQTVIDGFTFNQIPKDLQLYARSGNSASVTIEGFYDKSGGNPDYDRIRFIVDGNPEASPDLQYLGGGDLANFTFTTSISAGKINHSFEVRARIGNQAWVSVTIVSEVVAGDVYIIEGQSNAVASQRVGEPQSISGVDEFIRVYASGTESGIDLEADDNWHLAQPNSLHNVEGNAGQWGFRLGQMIVQNQNMPVAIFNGSRGGKKIEFFLKNGPDSNKDGDPSNNYERLLYRLNKTNLAGDVKAILWSQGENPGGVDVVNDYKSFFEDLLVSWNSDYNMPNQFYIFQTINGCTGTVSQLMPIKEAQRQLAVDYSNVQIMSTDGLAQYDEGGTNGYCHFVYDYGYKGFAERIYELVERDFYPPNNTTDIDAPDIIDAYLTGSTTLVIQTSASSLQEGTYRDIFRLEGAANGAQIIQNSIQVDVQNAKVIFELTAYPGAAYITNVGADPGVINNYIANSSGIELLSFYRYPFTGDISFPVDDNLMFTQYYEDDTSNNKWLEVKNISNVTVPANVFYLALYTSNNTNSAPDQVEGVPEMAPGEVVLFKRNGNIPTDPNLAGVQKIESNACRFNGNDVILISTSFDATAYTNRIDMLGDFPLSVWGRDTSFIKKDDNNAPDKDFNINNWIKIDNKFVNDVLSTDTNVTLGTHNFGNTDWDGIDWTNHDAGPTRRVTISNNYNANDGTLYAGDLTILANVDFDRNTTNSVVVHGDLDVSGGSLTIGDQESLVMYKADATISGTVTKIENSTSRNNLHDITYWSSPVISSDAQISGVFQGVDPSRIFFYDQSQSTATSPAEPGYWNVWRVAPGSMNMTAGVGFAAEGTGTGVHGISFDGEPNNGNVTVPVVYQDPGNDFNLVGNPYPSAIDISLFFAMNPNVDAAYFWTHNTVISGGNDGDFTTDDYASINNMGGTSAAFSGGAPPTDNIGSSQGFFIDVNDNSGSVTFTNDMRIVEANDQFFKSSLSKKNNLVKTEDEMDRIWLDLTTEQGGFSQILLGFKKGLTNGVDPGYDALRFSGSANPISFYSVIDSSKYVIQGKRTFISLRKFKLGFDTQVAPRQFRIGIAKKEGELRKAEVYLVDRYLKITHDLNISDYSFYQEVPGEFKDRFLLKFENSELPVIEDEMHNEFVVMNGFNDYIAIKANNLVTKVVVHDIYGAEILISTPHEYKFVINTNTIKSGTILLISVTFENGEVMNKKTVKL